ncbi:MAG TPA: helix-turn-helix domain-containing protein [Gammaproteobacteria bacterium]|nr:helix-turn-helix domain-containing protein [Gammaproteobacteria bacterium]HPQ25062.1 helix-turn-helix domain-containing protein [Gammaproteobacteria bacterium]
MDYLIHTSSQLAQALRARRKSLGSNQTDAGDRAGLSQNTVSKLELNPTPSTIDSLLRLISALDLELVLRPRQNSEPRPSRPAVYEEPEW